MSKRKKTVTPTELSGAEKFPNLKPYAPGTNGNPGGQSKEKRAFLERLRVDDVDEVYLALMDLVRERNAPAVLRAVEYIAGKPPETVLVGGKDATALTVELDPTKLSTAELDVVIQAQAIIAKQRHETKPPEEEAN